MAWAQAICFTELAPDTFTRIKQVTKILFKSVNQNHATWSKIYDTIVVSALAVKKKHYAEEGSGIKSTDLPSIAVSGCMG